jgi:hypothetical protein
MNNENIGSLTLLRIGCIFINAILLTGKQKHDMIVLFPRNQKCNFRGENLNVNI